MVTVKEWISGYLLKTTEKRLEELIKMNAPDVLIKGVTKQVEVLKKGMFNIGGDRSALADEFKDVERRVGRSGRTYYVFNGNINFFPEAQYGMFIKRVEEVV